MNRHLLLFCLFISAMKINSICLAEELAPRKGMGAVEQAKVHSVLSKQWVPKKTGTQPINRQDVVNVQNSTSGIGSKNCVTNIGTSNSNSNSLSSGRYGPSNDNKDNIIAIKGDVISICK